MTAQVLKKINEKYPVLIADLVDDSDEYMQVTRELLLLNGIENVREYYDPVEYETALADNPDLTPHIALVDYRFPSSGLTGIDVTRMLVERSRAKKLKTKVVMITGIQVRQQVIIDFFHLGGFGWVDKNLENCTEILKERIQLAVTAITEMLEELAWIEELKEDIKDEEPAMK